MWISKKPPTGVFTEKRNWPANAITKIDPMPVAIPDIEGDQFSIIVEHPFSLMAIKSVLTQYLIIMNFFV
jgi:hypothetical protein